MLFECNDLANKAAKINFAGFGSTRYCDKIVSFKFGLSVGVQTYSTSADIDDLAISWSYFSNHNFYELLQLSFIINLFRPGPALEPKFWE